MRKLLKVCCRKEKCINPDGPILFATLANFYHDNHRRDGLRSECKQCSEKTHPSDNRKRDRSHYQKEWRKRHPQYNKTWRDQHPTYSINYFRNHPERRRIYAAQRRARVIGAKGSYTSQEIKAQYKRQKGKCYWCNQSLNGQYEADHVIPITRGGDNYISNIVCACQVCNRSRNNKLPHEWEGSNKLL